MQRTISRNYFYNVVYQIVAIIAPLITAPYIARILLADGIGAFQYVSSIVNIFCIVIAFGTSSYAMREIAYVQDNIQARSQIFVEIVLLRSLAVAIALFPYFLLVRRAESSVLFQIMSIQIIAVAFETSWFFQGIEDFKSITVRNIIVRIASVILIFTCIKTKNDLPIYTLIIAGTSFAGCIAQLLCITKYVRIHDIGPINIKRHIYPSFALFIPTIAINIYTSLDKTVLGMLSTNYEVGYYSQVETIVKMCMLVITSLGTVLMPRIAHMLSTNSKEDVVKQIYKSCQFVLFIGFPMMVGMITISPIFIPMFFGQGYEKCIVLMRFMPLIVLIIGLASVTGASIMIPLKRQKQYTMSVVIGAFANLLLNCILIPHFGALGATVSTIAAEFAVLSLELYFIKDYVNVKKVLILGKNYAICSILMGFVLTVVINWFKPTIMHNLIFVLIGIVTYTILLFAMKDIFALDIKDTIIRMIGARKDVR